MRTDFNEDNAKIDAALKQQANSIASVSSSLSAKASTSSVTTVTNKINTEIQDRQSADAAEASARAAADNTEKAAREAADEAEAAARVQAISAEAAARTAALALKGNVQADVWTYVGDGLYGSSNLKRLTFSKRPLAFFVAGDDDTGLYLRGGSLITIRNYELYSYSCTWEGNTCSWRLGAKDAALNVTGVTYTVVALYAADE